jgi:6-phosphogluconolactonase (cycloisomerase 2 family)
MISECSVKTSDRFCDLKSEDYWKTLIFQRFFLKNNSAYCSVPEVNSGTTSIPLTISYSVNTYSYKQFTTITSFKPTLNKPTTICSSTPTLPEGLVISNSDCSISGTPILTQARTTYTITATDPTGTASANIAIDVQARQPRFLLASATGGNNVSVYSIAAGTGTLTQVPSSPFTAGAGSRSVSCSPTGTFCYVANGAGGTISGFSINSNTGFLTPVPGSPFAYPLSSVSDIAIDPYGKFIYVSAGGGSNFYQYTIDQTTGALTNQVAHSYPTVLTNFTQIRIDSTGKYLFFIDNLNPGRLYTYSIHSTSGNLTLIGNNTAGNNPAGFVVDPSSKNVYVVNFTSTNISAFRLDSFTGVLTPNNTFSTTGSCGFIATDRTGKFAYVTCGTTTIFGYNIDSNNGSLTSLPNTTVTTGVGALVIDPTNSFLYASSNPTSITGYTINNTTGALTQIAAPTTTPNGVAGMAIVSY